MSSMSPKHQDHILLDRSVAPCILHSFCSLPGSREKRLNQDKGSSNEFQRIFKEINMHNYIDLISKYGHHKPYHFTSCGGCTPLASFASEVTPTLMVVRVLAGTTPTSHQSPHHSTGLHRVPSTPRTPAAQMTSVPTERISLQCGKTASAATSDEQLESWFISIPKEDRSLGIQCISCISRLSLGLPWSNLDAIALLPTTSSSMLPQVLKMS